MFKTCAELFIVIIIGSGFIKSKIHISEGEGKQGRKDTPRTKATEIALIMKLKRETTIWAIQYAKETTEQ